MQGWDGRQPCWHSCWSCQLTYCCSHAVLAPAVCCSGDTWLRQDQVVPYCIALLEVFRWVLQPHCQYWAFKGAALPSGHF
jgi:hypothetical protein